MSAPYFVRPLSRSERRGLDAISRKPPDVRVLLRAQAVDLSHRGWKVHEIAQIVRRDRSLLSR